MSSARPAVPPAKGRQIVLGAWPRTKPTRIALHATAAMLGLVALSRVGRLDFAAFEPLQAPGPAFWTLFAAYYFTGPLVEWAIYRRIWPAWPGLWGALLRKLVSNELIFGLAGEVSFFAWANGRGSTQPAPLVVIKDVTLLSGLAGNLMTIAAMICSAPLLVSHIRPGERLVLWSGALTLAGISVAMLVLRRRLFSLPARECLRIGGLHVLRIVGQSLLLGALWKLLLPAIASQWLFALVALRLLSSRLPLTPNADIVFSGVAIYLLGSTTPLAAALAAITALLLLGHLALASMLMVRALLRSRSSL